MSITIYWACLEDEWMAATPPESVASSFYKKHMVDKSTDMSNIGPCPGFNGNLKNVFTLKSLYSYDFTIKDGQVMTDKYDQEFFESHVLIRSLEKKLFSFKNRYVFFTDESSLKVTLYEYPYLEDNNITDRCIPVTGQFDIGRWFRNSDYGFYLKGTQNTFKIEQGEVYSYVRFHTEEPIVFKQFRYTEVFDKYQKDCYSLTKLGLGNLDKYYSMFKTKKPLLAEIKKELL